MSRECTVYLVDTNIIISAIIRGRIARRRLETCPTRYLVPASVIEELLEYPTTEDFMEAAARIERMLRRGDLSIDELLLREVQLIAVLLKI